MGFVVQFLESHFYDQNHNPTIFSEILVTHIYLGYVTYHYSIIKVYVALQFIKITINMLSY